MTTQVKLNLTAINTYLLVILLIVLLYSAYSLLQVQQQFAKPVPAPKHAALTVTLIAAPECTDCLDSKLLTDAVRKVPLTNVSEKNVAFGTPEALQLLATYGINRLPAAIVTGEIENLTIPGFTKAVDAFVFSQAPPPYYDIAGKRVIGRVTLTTISDATCQECINVSVVAGSLKQMGVAVTSVTSLDAASVEAKKLIEKYGIRIIPTVLLSSEAMAYEAIAQAWPQAGTIEADGMLILRNLTPPYKEVKTGKVRGLVTLTYLTDTACTACYNASLHKLVLEQSFGMKFKDEKTIDVSNPAGNQLAEKYNITLVPTVVLDSEAEVYLGFAQAWSQIGTQATDGTFVFNKINLLQGVTYKDLSTGNILNATEE
jgi:hypothetical protein